MPKTKRTPKVEIYPDAAGEYRWRLLAANGAIIAQGEGHSTASNARRAARGMLRAAAAAVIVTK